MSKDKATEARQGFVDTVTGKAKEVVGAVSGNDELVEEGQLQQTEAHHRKEAAAEDAVADAERDEATRQMRESSLEAVEDKSEARSEAAREKAAAERQRSGERASADQAADAQEAAGRESAERRAEEVAESRLREAEAMEADADSTARRAAVDQAQREHEATAADDRAAQLRAETKK